VSALAGAASNVMDLMMRLSNTKARAVADNKVALEASRIKWVACIRDVGCAHPGLGFAPYLACICCPKVRCVHPSKWPFWLRASVPKTLACIRLRNDLCEHPFSCH